MAVWMEKIVILALALAVAGTGGLTAQALDLTVDEAVSLALDHNLTLRAEVLQLDARQRTKDLAWNAFLPKTGVTTSLSRLNQGQTSPLGGELPNYSIASASISAQLTISLALFDGIRHTTLDWQAGVIESETARQKLIRDTKKAYYQLLLLKQNIAIYEAQLETARKRYEREKKSFEAGQGSEFTMLSAQLAWENLKPGLEDVHIAESVALLGFKQLLGVDRAKELSLRSPPEFRAAPMNADAMVALAVARNGDLAKIRKTVEIQRNLRRGKFNLAYLPVLGFSFTADPTFRKDPFGDPWFRDPAADWKQNSGMVSVFLSLSLDSFLPFSSTAVELANMDDAIAQLEIGLQTATQGKEVQVTSLVLQVEKSRRTLANLELNVALATRALGMAEKGYEAGSYELLQVEGADNKLREARFNVLCEKFTYLSGLFDL